MENRWNLPALTARDAAAVDVSAALMLTTPRTDESHPLAGVVVSVAGGSAPKADQPSHLQEVQAELVAQLPVPDVQGHARLALPQLRTNEDYKTFIRSHMQGWQDSRKTPAFVQKHLKHAHIFIQRALLAPRLSRLRRH